MKKVLFFLLLPVIIYSQAGIPDNVFHKIGFQDYYYLWIASGKQFDQMPNNDFYYPLMDSLGLTHIVTYADPRALNNGQGIKLMDSRIEIWGHDSGLNDFWPMVYGYSSGNYSNSLPYEIGGPVASQTLKGDYWGIGNPAETSYWFRDSRTDHSAGDIDNNGGAITVIRFEKDIDQPDVMIKSNIIPNHQTNTYILPQYDQKYKVGIRAKIATISGGNDNDIVATITVTEVGWQNIVIPPDKLSKIDTLSFSKTRALLYSSNITAGQLTDTYTDLTFAPFYKTDANMALEILIDWKNTRTMSVDKIWVFDNYYEKLFYTDPTVSETNISNKISLKLNLNNEFNNSNYYHLYMDEPAPLQNRSYDKVSSISSNLPNGKYMNAANWAFPESELAVENYFRRPNYVSIDYYPFGNIGYGTTEVQTSLDNLIAYSN